MLPVSVDEWICPILLFSYIEWFLEFWEHPNYWPTYFWICSFCWLSFYDYLQHCFVGIHPIFEQGNWNVLLEELFFVYVFDHAQSQLDLVDQSFHLVLRLIWFKDTIQMFHLKKTYRSLFWTVPFLPRPPFASVMWPVNTARSETAKLSLISTSTR